MSPAVPAARPGRRRTTTPADAGRAAGRGLRLYEITYLGTGPEPEVRTVEAGEVAAVIEHAGEHGVQVLVRPCRGQVGEPSTRKEDAS